MDDKKKTKVFILDKDWDGDIATLLQEVVGLSMDAFTDSPEDISGNEDEWEEDDIHVNSLEHGFYQLTEALGFVGTELLDGDSESILSALLMVSGISLAMVEFLANTGDIDE